MHVRVFFLQKELGESRGFNIILTNLSMVYIIRAVSELWT